ncbi:MAG: YicC family protein [bacterium]|nr:YicC family protein [bacterium]
MKSMTGFAQGRFEFNNISLHIIIKSLNHRYLDIHFKGTGITPEWEKRLKTVMKGKVSRGKLEIVFDLFQSDQSKCNIQLNDRLLSDILDELSYFKKKYRDLSLSLDSLLRIPMVFHLDYLTDEFNERDTKEINNSIEKILAEFLESRENEGKAIASDLNKSIDKIETNLEILKKEAVQLEKNIFLKYKEKIAKYLTDIEIDERRVAQEAAVLAEKNCINEEIHRLDAHTRRLKELIKNTRIEAKGREADFLSQEMQRETYTIASKTSSMDIHDNVLVIRREIEKIKQQVQNVE